MKIKVHGATFAILEIVTEMAANQRAFQKILLTNLAANDDEAVQAISHLNEEVKNELGLLRSRMIRHSEIDINDALDFGVEF